MKSILYLAILLLFASCSIKTHYVQTGSKTYPPTDPATILIYSKVPERQYDVIGSVAIFSAGDKQAVKVLTQLADLDTSKS